MSTKLYYASIGTFIKLIAWRSTTIRVGGVQGNKIIGISFNILEHRNKKTYEKSVVI